MCIFNNPETEAFWNIVGKEENAGNQHFLLFPATLSTHTKNFCMLVTFILSSANVSNLDQSENLSFGKELTSVERMRNHERGMNPVAMTIINRKPIGSAGDWNKEPPNLKILLPVSYTPLWDHPKFKEAADDNWNVVIKGF